MNSVKLKSLSINLQVPVYVAIFSWKHCCFCEAFTLYSGSLPASKRRRTRGTEQGQMITRKGVWCPRYSAEPSGDTGERKEGKKVGSYHLLFKLTTPQIWKFPVFLTKILLIIVITLFVITLPPYFITRDPNYNCSSFIRKLSSCLFLPDPDQSFSPSPPPPVGRT